MSNRIVSSSVEGLVSQVGIEFDNGIKVILHTKGSIAFLGKEGRQKVSDQLDDLIKILEEHGFIVEGKNPLK